MNSKVCNIEGCGRLVLAHGWCSKHYQRWQKYGDPLHTQIVRSDDDHFEQLFWQQANVTADINRCWNWQRALNKDGYGKVCLKRTYPYLQITGWSVTAHRLAYALFYKSDPADLCVLHSCDNPQCINPYHLWLGTVQDNNADKKAKGHYEREWVASRRSFPEQPQQ